MGIQVESEAEDFTPTDVGARTHHSSGFAGSSSSSSSSTGHCMQCLSPDNWILGWDSRVSPLCMTDCTAPEDSGLIRLVSGRLAVGGVRVGAMLVVGCTGSTYPSES